MFTFVTIKSRSIFQKKSVEIDTKETKWILIGTSKLLPNKKCPSLKGLISRLEGETLEWLFLSRRRMGRGIIGKTLKMETYTLHRFNRSVIKKVYLSPNGKEAEKALQEVAVMKSLSHPNIVQ